ncbi:hypothetical protein AUC69_04530 [Methyloceanibacter superfactus]|uniref:Uncharacterized protein n=1 Tax=Methyloceanibacter superfactus TaxID=1774969 RepID=A0A1E3W7S7_9HYPH|nr:hypothetical protein AUC69_04530 [Methyloceanibacter superfactus]
MVAMSGSAFAVSLSHSLKNYYAEYEIVLHCQTLSQLSADDAEAAKSAIAKIETYYLNKDSSIDKAPLLKAAIADKDEASGSWRGAARRACGPIAASRCMSS